MSSIPTGWQGLNRMFQSGFRREELMVVSSTTVRPNLSLLREPFKGVIYISLESPADIIFADRRKGFFDKLQRGLFKSDGLLRREREKARDLGDAVMFAFTYKTPRLRRGSQRNVERRRLKPSRFWKLRH